MIQHKMNGWFNRTDLGNAANAIRTTAAAEPGRWLHHGGLDCKYVEIRIDMRTGDFVMMNATGARMTNEVILDMFPQLGPIEVVG